MADDELEQIRAARLAQLKQQGGGGGGGGAGASGGQQSPEDRQAAASEQRQSILNQILEPAAQERLGRIRLVKATRAEDVENRLIMLAKSGQLREKITEEKLKGLLEAVAENEEVKKISVVRRKGAWDDDDDDDLFNM